MIFQESIVLLKKVSDDVFMQKIDYLNQIYEPIDVVQESHLSFMKILNLGNKNIMKCHFLECNTLYLCTKFSFSFSPKEKEKSNILTRSQWKLEIAFIGLMFAVILLGSFLFFTVITDYGVIC